MDKKEIRAVIKYLHIKEMNTKEIHDDIVQILSEESPSCSSVKKGLLISSKALRALVMLHGRVAKIQTTDH